MKSDRPEVQPESNQPKSRDGRRRNDLASALERDFERRRRREKGHRSYWRWLGVLGMVGWPIAFMTVGGALLGHYLDVRFNLGIQFTLLLLTIGVVIGSLVAWNVIGKDR
jgi:ATP synthase protein I